MPSNRRKLPDAVEGDSRERGSPIRFGVPEIHALDDASISGQVDNATGAARGDVAAHLNFAARSVSILDDDAQEIDGTAVDAQLDRSKGALLASLDSVVVQAAVDPARAEKDHLRLLASLELRAENCYSNEQKQDRDEATAARLQHVLFSESLTGVQPGLRVWDRPG